MTTIVMKTKNDNDNCEDIAPLMPMMLALYFQMYLAIIVYNSQSKLEPVEEKNKDRRQ
jgi:hypothetical protein